MSLVAETTTGCVISTDTTVSYHRGDGEGEMEEEKKELMPAEDVGEQAASALLGEIEQGGVVDSAHQVCFLFLFFGVWPSILNAIHLENSILAASSTYFFLKKANRTLP